MQGKTASKLQNVVAFLELLSCGFATIGVNATLAIGGQLLDYAFAGLGLRSAVESA